MARRLEGSREFENTPRVYARTTDTWTTRVGKRNSEFLTFANMLGMNTAFDDLHKTDGESPFLRNVVYMGQKQKEQRAQVTSRSGARFVASVGDETHYPDRNEAETEIELYEGKAIEFEAEFTNILVGGCIFVRNTEGNTGVLRVELKRDFDSKPICDAAIDLTTVSKNDFNQRNFRFIKCLTSENSGSNPYAAGGKCVIKLEVVDDINPDARKLVGASPSSQHRIHVLATGRSIHLEANYQLPSTNKCLKEIPYTWHETPSIPLFGTVTNPNRPLKNGIVVCVDGAKYAVYPIRPLNGVTEIWRTRLDNGESAKIDCQVENVDVVRFGKPIQGNLYYVDGVSPLRRIKLDGSWQGEDAIPKAEDIATEESTPVEDLTAKRGAKYIKVYNNRIYLANFPAEKDENGKPKGGPDFVQMSLINDKGAQPDQFSTSNSFYSSNQSPYDTTCSPITGLNILAGNLYIWRTDGNAVFSAPQGLEAGKPQLVNTYAWNIGILEQEDCAEANDNLYIWNPSEGVRRITGTDSSFQSLKIDNEFRGMTPQSDRFMLAHSNAIYFYFDRDNHGMADYRARFHMALASQSPWYMDDNTPAKWAAADDNSDTVFVMHAQYPALYIADYQTESETQLTDFDSSIIMQYNTQYKTPGGTNGWSLVRNIYAKIIANMTTSWYIGIDTDHKDNPSVWRKDVVAQNDPAPNPDAMFSPVSSPGARTLNIMMNKTCREIQIRFYVICNRGQAELLMAAGDYGSKNPL